MKLEAISTKSTKEKLINLREYVSGYTDITYDFAEFLAERLKPKLSPVEFNIAIELAFYDMQNGTESLFENSLHTGLQKYPPMIYPILETDILKIAEAICPRYFFQEFKKVYEEIRK